MKTIRTLATLLFAFLLLGCNQTNSKKKENNNSSDRNDSKIENTWTGKYKLNSGIIKYKLDMGKEMAAMGSTMEMTKYFDNHGEKEMNETSTKISVAGMNMNTTSRSIIKDGWAYNWQTDKKTGYKTKITDFDPEQLDYRNLKEEIMDKYKMKDEGTATVQDKTCHVYSYTADMKGKSMSGKSYIWDNIMMKMETTMEGRTMGMEVSELTENAKLESSLFEIPTDVVFKEIAAPVKSK